jgi:dCMP deaminase
MNETPTKACKETNKEINYIPVKTPITWDEYFMLQAMMASFRSKDPSTKVGSVFVDPNRHQISMGYNGFVAGIDEEKLPWGKDPSVGLEFQKYGYVVHAETNAILHATRELRGSSCYVTLFPCNECAKLIASKKVKEVVFLSDKHQDREHTRMAKKIFDLAGVKYRPLKMDESIVNDLNGHLSGLLGEL